MRSAIKCIWETVFKMITFYSSEQSYQIAVGKYWGVITDELKFERRIRNV